ncbi:hypothetical protein [Hyalangium rubrum]|uniref:Uncharacterized protein n=1 Tax=Hyalangium rubrum TaxID=3103134 RepID=A0ABU5GZ38_9BACT|nr:hypothetical protein [Hyalangium sp. s54d21]MDY7225807.1 hypothetical protein [Hyalangium sp. s54d21]
MSESRALRDRLEKAQAELRRTKEHLEKLRVHHARERESLGQELEEARRQVLELRGRLTLLETRERALRADEEGARLAASVLPERALSAGPGTALVALVQSPASLNEALPKLAELLKLSPVDVRFRLAPLLPTVLARLPLPEAQALRDALRAEGFMAVSSAVPHRLASGLMAVRRFTLDAEGVDLEGTRKERQRVLYPQLRLLIRGRRITTTVESEVEETYDADGDRVRKMVEVKHDHIEQFLWLYGDGVRAAFSLETRFSGLGSGRGLSGFESLQRVMEELRRGAPQVVVDERFMRMPRFRLPLVDEDRGQELLGELLHQAVQEGLWP